MELLHNLPGGWEMYTLEDVTLLVSGQHLKKGEYSESNTPESIPYLTGPAEFGAISPEPSRWTIIRRSVAIAGDTLITVKGSGVGKVNMMTASEIAISRQLMAVRSNGQIDNNYLYLFFQAHQQVFADKKTGVAIPGIRRQDVLEQTIPVPPLEEQRRIVTKLNAFITRIDTAMNHLQGNLKLSKDLFASALVDSFKSNPVWRSCTVKDVFKVINGRAYKKAELLDSGKYRVVRIQNLKGGMSYYYSNLELNEDKYCSRGDLLFSWSGTPGTSFGAFIWDGEKSIYHYHIWKMELLGEMDIRFAYWLLRDLTEEAISKSRGVAGMLHITKGMMESFEIALPPLIEQQKIATKLDALSRQTRAIEAATEEKLRDLAALKSSLLDNAFRGQL